MTMFGDSFVYNIFTSIDYILQKEQVMIALFSNIYKYRLKC